MFLKASASDPRHLVAIEWHLRPRSAAKYALVLTLFAAARSAQGEQSVRSPLLLRQMMPICRQGTHAAVLPLFLATRSETQMLHFPLH
jgi:hypothetical protein